MKIVIEKPPVEPEEPEIRLNISETSQGGGFLFLWT